MTLVLNKDYGGFSIPKGFIKTHPEYNSCYDNIERSDPDLIAYVRDNENDCGDLELVEIPDNNTDYSIDEYDGFESVVYVVNGKLHWA
jgi:hypothetical protein